MQSQNNDWVLELLHAIGWELCKTAKNPQQAFAFIELPYCGIKQDLKGMIEYLSRLL